MRERNTMSDKSVEEMKAAVMNASPDAKLDEATDFYIRKAYAMLPTPQPQDAPRGSHGRTSHLNP
jgi:hypothetical protein